VQPDDAVAVVGVGFIGAVALRMAVAAGGRVFAFARRPWALDLARRLGATAALPLDGDPLARLRAANGGQLADVAIEAVGLQAPLDLAADALREQGRLVIAGFHQDGRRTIDLCAWNWKGLDVVNAHFRDPAVNVDGIRAALDAVQTGTLRIEDFVTHAFPLARIGEAFEAMRSRPDGFLKGVVTP
jgi:threonine dehydrogenase-like Zn-dependent dehydrogenase